MKSFWRNIVLAALLPALANTRPVDQAEAEPKLSARQLNPFVTYKSVGFQNPAVTITKAPNADLAPGYFIMAPEYDGAGSQIITGDGDLVFRAPKYLEGLNLRVQQLNGNMVLTNYVTSLAVLTKGIFYGATRIMDSSYSILYTVCPKLGLYIPFANPQPDCEGDLHEQVLTPEGTLLITAYNVTEADLSAIGGPADGWVVEAQIYELDLDGSTVIFSWKSLSHVPITKTKAPFGAAGGGTSPVDSFDYFHLNSVQKIGGNYLVNGRHVWANFLIDGATGSIIWEFNGYDGGDFGPLPSVPTGDAQHAFAWQHDAKILSMTANKVVLSMFDNDNNNPSAASNPSSGLVFRLNTKLRTSALLHDYRDPTNPVISALEGGMQTLSNGNALVTYGNMPTIQEYSPSDDTHPQMTLSFGPGPRGGSYRIYKTDWVGEPKTLLSVVLDTNNSVGYVSWNGATEVAKWVVASGTKTTVKHTADVTKTGFESQFALPKVTKTGGRYLIVRALNAAGDIIGVSRRLQFAP